VVDTAGLKYVEIEPVQSYALEWAHLRVLRSTLNSAVETGECHFLVLTGTDTADELLAYLEWTRPREAWIAVAVASTAQAGTHAATPNFENALAWLASASHEDDEVTFWVDDERLRTPVEKVFYDNRWCFRSVSVSDHLPRLRIPASSGLAEQMPQVPVLPVGIGATGWLTEALRAIPFDALVLEAFAAGDLPPALLVALDPAIMSGRPVVMASRNRPGVIAPSFPGIPGASTDTLGRGLLGAGALPPHLARLRLALVLATKPMIAPCECFSVMTDEAGCSQVQPESAQRG
jgi:L-asparaginase/Glu-tRNA(Gln) amidotransferase subunit D